MGAQIPGPSTEEDRLSAVALGKTIAFLVYSVLAFLASSLVVLAPAVEGLSRRGQALAAVGLLAALEIALLWLVVAGKLPGTKPSQVEPFNERQIATGLGILSLLTVLLLGTGLQGRIIRAVLNGALFVCVGVYFVAKSVLSRSVRWGVLGVLLVPGVQLLWDAMRRDV